MVALWDKAHGSGRLVAKFPPGAAPRPEQVVGARALANEQWNRAAACWYTFVDLRGAGGCLLQWRCDSLDWADLVQARVKPSAWRDHLAEALFAQA